MQLHHSSPFLHSCIRPLHKSIAATCLTSHHTMVSSDPMNGEVKRHWPCRGGLGGQKERRRRKGEAFNVCCQKLRCHTNCCLGTAFLQLNHKPSEDVIFEIAILLGIFQFLWSFLVAQAFLELLSSFFEHSTNCQFEMLQNHCAISEVHLLVFLTLQCSFLEFG